MEKAVENSRRRWADLMNNELHRLTDAAAWKALRGKYSCTKTKWEAEHTVKYQCCMSIKEAAALEAIRISTMPGISRYGMVRGLLLALIRAKEEEGNEEGGNCCPQRTDGSH